ncbi:MAG TPA: carboxypeptidase-like regulatory domain-containing protein [Chitinivibrionales bacterium]|nr:carboxypeptidase-like regulatory domain-containing protein [Chitinivibrionales bacterium]
MVGRRIALCAFVAALALRAGAQDINITGTVIDGSGNGVSGATVSLMYAGLSTTSASDGSFSLVQTTAVRSMLESSAPVSAAVSGNTVCFSVAAQSPVRIDVYAMNGRMVSSSLSRMLCRGVYAFAPGRENITPGIYFIKVSIGAWSTVCKMTLAGGQTAGPALRQLSGSAQPLSKKADVADTLVASKGGYKTFKKFISSYTLASQICVLTAITKSPETAIYSQRVTKSIDWANTTVQVWDYTAAHTDTSLHLTSTALDGANTVDPYPGNTKCWLVTCGTVGWSTWGFVVSAAVGSVDMSGFYGGNIHFYIRGSSPSVGAFIASTGGAGTAVDLSTLGYAADSTWHEITLPLSSFPTVDLSAITDYLMFVAPVTQGAGYTAGSWYALDDITYRPAP